MSVPSLPRVSPAQRRATIARLAALLPDRRDCSDLRGGWSTDLLAGVTVAVVALPLALAFGVASGVGATAGLVTAIVAGAVAAVFAGPTCRSQARRGR